jgi:hypothetical protein
MLPASPTIGRLLTICDGTGQDPTVAPGYTITVNANIGHNVIAFGKGRQYGFAPTFQMQAQGSAFPAVDGTGVAHIIQGSGWSVTIQWNGAYWQVLGYSY